MTDTEIAKEKEHGTLVSRPALGNKEKAAIVKVQTYSYSRC